MVMDDKMVKLVQQQQQLIIAMKGHPGSGKSTLARAISSALRFPLIDKDDVRDCTAKASFTHHLHQQHHHEEWQEEVDHMMNELSYEVIWRIAKTQLELGLSVVIDSPLSRRSHLNRLLQLTNAASSSSSSSRVIRLVIIECRPQDEAEWRRRLEDRGRTIVMCDDGDDDGRRKASSSHKPLTWEDLERLMERYNGCWDYDIGDVPKLVLDTTAPSSTGVGSLVPAVLKFLSSVSSYDK